MRLARDQQHAQAVAHAVPLGLRRLHRGPGVDAPGVEPDPLRVHLEQRVPLVAHPRERPTDRLDLTIERQLAYNVVTKEYKVVALKGETRAAHGTRVCSLEVAYIGRKLYAAW